MYEAFIYKIDNLPNFQKSNLFQDILKISQNSLKKILIFNKNHFSIFTTQLKIIKINGNSF